MSWGGLHAPESGTYYLALHDVTPLSNTVNVDYILTISEHLQGDSNGDGTVDVADIAEIIDTMAKGLYRVHADANGDGAVDVADIAEVISIMAARARMKAAAEE